MQVEWTGRALKDLDRLYRFRAKTTSKEQAGHLIKYLRGAPESLLVGSPRIGERLVAYSPKEVRKFLLDQYEFHYEIRDPIIYVVRIWSTREDR